MCGIVAIIKKKEDGISTAETAKGMLQAQITRGQQGFGYVGFDSIVRSYVRRETKYEIEQCLEKSTAQSILLHHRFPTSTPNYADCTHPIKVSHDELAFDYYVIHNGVISNDGILKETHNELGYVYNTTVTTKISTQNKTYGSEKWNDSEALAIDLARFFEGKQDKILSRGSIAFVALRVNKATNDVSNVLWGRNGSPLTIKVNEDSIILRSENETEIVPLNKLFILDMASFTTESYDCPIGEVMSVGNWNGYNNVPNYSPEDWEDDELYRVGYPSKFTRRSEVLDIEAREVAEMSDDDLAYNEFINEEVKKLQDGIDVIIGKKTTLMEELDYNKSIKNQKEVDRLGKAIAVLDIDIEELEADIDDLLQEAEDETIQEVEDISTIEESIEV